VRYYLTSGRAATELIVPAHREDRFRLVRGLRDSFRDKTVSTALDRFAASSDRLLRSARRNAGGDPARALAQLARNPPADLVPVARFFGDRFERAHLDPGERMVRQEIWYGTAPLPTEADPGSERLNALRRYYAGPTFAPVGQHAAEARYGAIEREADIVWALLYVHEP
jgi:hypothetical protein